MKLSPLLGTLCCVITRDTPLVESPPPEGQESAKHSPLLDGRVDRSSARQWERIPRRQWRRLSSLLCLFTQKAAVITRKLKGNHREYRKRRAFVLAGSLCQLTPIFESCSSDGNSSRNNRLKLKLFEELIEIMTAPRQREDAQTSASVVEAKLRMAVKITRHVFTSTLMPFMSYPCGTRCLWACQ